MNVKLAAQTLSSGIAVAIEYLKIDSKIENFQTVTAPLSLLETLI